MPRVLLLIFATGWAANHFSAMLPVLADSAGLSAGLLYGAYGVYALGQLPSLIVGGAVSDRIGRAPLALGGATVAAAGNALMGVCAGAVALYVGRAVVGVGVGLTVSAATAWAADLRGKAGAVSAGMMLPCGFAFGALGSGLLAQLGPAPLALPFCVTTALSLVAVAVALRARDGGRRESTGLSPSFGGSVEAALSSALPMAVWVFTTVSVAIVTLADRIGPQFHGPLVPGVAAVISLGTGVAAQALARWTGSAAVSGTIGAVLAAVGFGLTAMMGSAPPVAALALAVAVLGAASGLCLSNGLVDIERLAPTTARGKLTGVFYGFAYLGFGLPLLLEVLRPAIGDTAPMVALTAIAVTTAVLRTRALGRLKRLGR